MYGFKKKYKNFHLISQHIIDKGSEARTLAIGVGCGVALSGDS